MRNNKTYSASIGAYRLRVVIPRPSSKPKNRRPHLEGIGLTLAKGGNRPLINIRGASASPCRPPFGNGRVWVFGKAQVLWSEVCRVFGDDQFDLKTARIIQARYKTNRASHVVFHFVILDALDKILLDAYPIPRRAKL